MNRGIFLVFFAAAVPLGALGLSRGSHQVGPTTFDVLPVLTDKQIKGLGFDMARYPECDARCINDHGDIVGVITGQLTTGAYRRIAFIVRRGRLVTIEPVSGKGFEPKAINNSDVVAGGIGDGMPRVAAAIWRNGKLTRLSNLANDPDAYSEATGINDAGTVTGWSDTSVPIRQPHAVIWTKAEGVADLGPPPARPFTPMSDGGPSGATTCGLAINAMNDIIGTGMHFFAWRPGLLWSHGKATALGHDLKGGVSQDRTVISGDRWDGLNPTAINDLGEIVGTRGLPGYGRNPCRWDDGKMSPLGGDGMPLAINAAGTVVGTSNFPLQYQPRFNETYPLRALIWLDGRTSDLNGLANTNGWTLQEAVSINARGQILCLGYRKEGTWMRLNAFVLTPR